MKTALVIMAAGLGTRYGGIKQMDGVGPNGEIIMEYAIYDAVRAGFDRAVIVLAPGMEKDVRERFGDGLIGGRTPEGKSFEVRFATQDNALLPGGYVPPAERKRPFGTVFAAYCARDAVEDMPFAIINADDYYGVKVFSSIHDRLVTLEPGQGCMAGYILENTVSENGTVARAVCHVENGLLKDATEMTKIRRFEDGTLRDENNPGLVLDPRATVSMNFFGFASGCFGMMEEYLRDFLAEIGPDELSRECQLPTMVDKLIKSGKLSLLVEPADDKWTGMTYRQDKEGLAATLAGYHDKGIYPKSLRP